MIGNALNGALLAVGLVAVTTLIITVLAGTAINIPLELLIPGVALAVSPGLGALGAAAFYRIYSGTKRVGWAFIFTASGLLNVVFWIIVGFFPSNPPAGVMTAVYVDLVGLFPYLTLAITILWSICGGVFSWLDARMVASEKRS